MLKNERRFSMSCRPEIRTMFARTRASLWSKVLERDRMAATHIFDAPPEGVAADWTMPQKWSAFTAERSEEHTSELQSLKRSSYAVFCLTNKTRSQQKLKRQANNNKNATHE